MAKHHGHDPHAHPSHHKMNMHHGTPKGLYGPPLHQPGGHPGGQFATGHGKGGKERHGGGGMQHNECSGCESSSEYEYDADYD